MAVICASRDFGDFGGWAKIDVWRDVVVWISEMPHRILKRMVGSESCIINLSTVKRALRFYAIFWS